jgi:heme-degrading monooxygenase HmoA
MPVIIMRAQLRAGFEQEVAALVSVARDLAARSEGFVAFERAIADDGQNIVLLEFESHEALAAWRDHPNNIATQAAGRDRFFKSYSIQVCDVVRGYEFID